MSSSYSSTKALAVAQTPAPAPAPAPEVRAKPSKSSAAQCERCLEYFSKKNIADHRKVHKLEDQGVAVPRPCNNCRILDSNCIVAEHPQDLNTYSCLCCLRAHKSCSFTSDGIANYVRTGERWTPYHPALGYEEEEECLGRDSLGESRQPSPGHIPSKE
ncbi:hypothetical protein NW762_010047 [Fusarium torreyae]|uniref:Uncharacterized protein n=1 Tax=Fusarium torreyae TaxID=1237075 RepID=A0A9W8RU46_9HYPO|nr:hypothetical protein NW762_010047 [Fusarium torreyae]